MTIDYKADARPLGDQSELEGLAAQLETAYQREEELAAEAKMASRNVRELETKIGEKLAEHGIVGNGSTINLSNGKTLKLSEQTYVSIPAANKPQAYAWLKDNGMGALVEVETRENVHPGRLRPLAEDLPTSLFKVSTVKKVKIQ